MTAVTARQRPDGRPTGKVFQTLKTDRPNACQNNGRLRYPSDSKPQLIPELVTALQSRGSGPALPFLESSPPYAQWQERRPNVNHFSGYSVHTFRGVTYL